MSSSVGRSVGSGVSAAQQRLIDAAVDAFAEQGFGGTSTRDIAERAGKSTAAVYVHYKSKEELLYAISLIGHRGSLAALEDASMSGAEPLKRLHDMVFAFSYWHLENAKLGRVVQYELPALSRTHRSAIIALRRRFHVLMVEVLEEGIETGLMEVPDVHSTARALLSLGIDLARWFDPALRRDPKTVALANAAIALRIVKK